MHGILLINMLNELNDLNAANKATSMNYTMSFRVSINFCPSIIFAALKCQLCDFNGFLPTFSLATECHPCTENSQTSLPGSTDGECLHGRGC